MRKLRTYLFITLLAGSQFFLTGCAAMMIACGAGMAGGAAVTYHNRTALDPVSAHRVKVKKAPSAPYKGKTYYFENDEHKQKFLESPQTYVNSDSSN